VIELDLRTSIAYYFGQNHGAFGHTDARNFYRYFKHQQWLDKLHEEARRSNEAFVEHFSRTYSQFPDLPIWRATEIMSFGGLSHMVKGMRRVDQRVVASRYGRQARDMASWMHHLVYIRNLCAHHARLWDRSWGIKPNLPKGTAWSAPMLPGNDHLFVTLLILNSMLTCCPMNEDFRIRWRRDIEDLLKSPPAALGSTARMGLTQQWTAHRCWA
jgi:abortive infection bacteriophage resistance protein